MNTKYIIAIIVLMAQFGLAAQDLKSLTLQDSETGNIITQATFEYGNQKGISDENGRFKINFDTKTLLQISHVVYGVNEYQPKEVKVFLEKGIILLTAKQENLYPVTVLSLRPKARKHEVLKLQSVDKLAFDGAEILKKSAVISGIKKSGSYGFDPVFRGFKYDQINIVTQGCQTASAACPNRMDPPTSQMSPNMIDRVEILKGPYALRFGTGLGATINYITKKGQFTPEMKWNGRASLGYQSNGNGLRSEISTGFSTKNIHLNFFGAFSKGDDYTDGRGEEVRSGYQRASYGLKGDFKLSSAHEIGLLASNNRASDVDFVALPMDLRSDDTWMLNLEHRWAFSGRKLQNWKTNIYASLVDHLMDNHGNITKMSMVKAHTDAHTKNIGFRTEGTWKTTNGKWFGGADTRWENIAGTRFREMLMGPKKGKIMKDNVWQNGSILRSAIFVEYQGKQDVWEYVLSSRLAFNQSDANELAASFKNRFPEGVKEKQINPNISLGVHYSLNDYSKFSLWMAHVQRSGSITERFINSFPVGNDPYELVGNPIIKPEKNKQIDFGYEYQTEKTAIGATIYASYLSDYISSIIDPKLKPVMKMSPGVRVFSNIDQALRTGFEIQWKQALMENVHQEIQLAYTYGKDVNTDEALPEIAPLDMRYQLGAELMKGKIIPSLELRYVADQKRIATAFGETKTPSFFLMNLAVEYLPFKNARLKLGVDNLFNTAYYEHLNRSVRGTNNLSIYDMGRNIHAAFSYRF
ncbi:MAG: TonB-dependent receptor [Flavobacteriales bacterium]|jgi:iron complex outermembrane receptor protein|nr:TonB-dependent receptor [Flavobacteriales bacterium]